VILIPALLFTAVLVALLNWLALRPYHRTAGQHWTERARVLWPIRQSSSFALWLSPVITVLLGLILVPETTKDTTWPVGVAAVVGAFIGAFPMDRVFFPDMTVKSWAHQVLAWWSIRLAGFAALATAGVMMPREWGWETVSWTVGGVGLFAWLQWRGWLWLAEVFRIAEPAPDHIAELMNSLASRQGVQLNGIWKLRSVIDGAFALPLTRELLFTERALQVHSDEEIAAIAGHELGHLRESNSALVIRASSMFVFAPWVLAKPLFASLDSLLALLVLNSTFVFIWLIKRFSRRMELAADAAGQAAEAEAGCYARALERLHEVNLIPAVFPKDKLTHPHLYDRLVAIGHTPDYARPAKPKDFNWVVPTLILLIFGLTIVWAARGGG